MRRHAGARARAARRSVRGRDVRIGTMVDIEECSLRSLKKDFLTALKGAMKVDNRVADEGT